MAKIMEAASEQTAHQMFRRPRVRGSEVRFQTPFSLICGAVVHPHGITQLPCLRAPPHY